MDSVNPLFSQGVNEALWILGDGRALPGMMSQTRNGTRQMM